jgi:hypothetical protein
MIIIIKIILIMIIITITVITRNNTMEQRIFKMQRLVGKSLSLLTYKEARLDHASLLALVPSLTSLINSKRNNSLALLTLTTLKTLITL